MHSITTTISQIAYIYSITTMALDACNCLFIPSESHMDSLFGLSSLGAALPIGTTRTCSEARIPIFHFPPKPAVIAVRKGQRNYDSDSNDGGIEYKNLRELVESRCPSLFTEFHPLWYLFKCVTILSTIEELPPTSTLKWTLANHVLCIR
jgi:hypothetical protein